MQPKENAKGSFIIDYNDSKVFGMSSYKNKPENRYVFQHDKTDYLK